MVVELNISNKINFKADVEIGKNYLVLGTIKVLKDMSYEEFDEVVTELVKKLIYKYAIDDILNEPDDVGYDYDYHVATLVFNDDTNIKADVLIAEANRIVDDEPYVREGEEFELYLQFRKP